MMDKDLSYYMSRPYKIEFMPEEVGFTVTIPDLKGCISFGDTIQEAYQMITEAKSLWIETALDKRWSIPEPVDLELEMELNAWDSISDEDFYNFEKMLDSSAESIG